MKLYSFISGRSDIVEFRAENYDAFIYASRAVEALLMLIGLAGLGLMVQRVTQSAIAAVLFQVGPFVHFELMHFELLLTPESLMISCVVLGTGLVLKSALGREPPTAGLGVAQGLVFALGLSSKYLYAPLAILSVALLRSWRAYLLATLAGAIGFFVFNRILNPYVFTSGFHWLVSIATHKGIYGAGEPGFIDFNLFWSNMGQIIAASPLISAVFVLGGCVALAQILTSRDYLESGRRLTLLACFIAFAAQLLATSKHFNLHYMVASWTLTGGVLVLSVIEMRRLWPALSPRLLAGAAGLICIALVSTSLIPAQGRSGEMEQPQPDRRQAVASRRLCRADLRQCLRHVRARAGERVESRRGHDTRHPENAGQLLGSLCAGLQGAVAGSQLLPQCPAPEFHRSQLRSARP